MTTTEALSASQRGRHEESHTVLQEIAALSSLSAADGDSHDVAQGQDLDELAAARGASGQEIAADQGQRRPVQDLDVDQGEPAHVDVQELAGVAARAWGL